LKKKNNFFHYQYFQRTIEGYLRRKLLPSLTNIFRWWRRWK